MLYNSRRLQLTVFGCDLHSVILDLVFGGLCLSAEAHGTATCIDISVCNPEFLFLFYMNPPLTAHLSLPFLLLAK